jgi:hypothetical protein
MAFRNRSGRGAAWRLVGFALSAAGVVLVAVVLPRWLWLLGLGAILIWSGLLLAIGPQ